MFENKVLMAALLSMLFAQLSKVLWTLFTRGEIDFRRLVDAGGMPSSHTALVVSLAVGIGKQSGTETVEFAIATVFALIVMYDAAGVRRAVGNQAEVLNKLITEIYLNHEIKHEMLKEFLGHTPKEVFAGALLGTVLALLIVT